MTRAPNAKRGGKRMETDDEYRVRLREAGHRAAPDRSGRELDRFGDAAGMPRRIVEPSD